MTINHEQEKAPECSPSLSCWKSFIKTLYQALLLHRKVEKTQDCESEMGREMLRWTIVAP